MDEQKRKRFIVGIAIAMILFVFIFILWHSHKNAEKIEELQNNSQILTPMESTPKFKRTIRPDQILTWVYYMQKRIEKLEMRQKNPSEWQENMHTLGLLQNDTAEKTNVLLGNLIKEIEDLKLLISLSLSAEQRKQLLETRMRKTREKQPPIKKE